MLTLLGYVFKNLGRQKLRTVLTALGVMIGVWLVVIFAAISAGMMETQEAILTEFGEDLHVYKAGVADPFLSSLPESATRERLLAFDGVGETASFLYWFTRLKRAPFALMVGLRPEEFALARLLERGTGGFSGPEADEAILGAGLLGRLGTAVGESVEIEGVRFRVVGTFATGSAIFDNALVIPFERMRDIYYQGGDYAIYLAVRVAKGRSPKEVADRLEREYGEEYAVVRTLEELTRLDQGLQHMEEFSLVIAVVATLLGALFLTLVMLMSVRERTREVGILRATGWRKREIVLVVFLEAALIAVLGALVGIPTGQLIVELIARVTDLSSFLHPTYEVGLYVESVLVALLAAAIGGIVPSWRAGRLRPVEALSHE